MEQIRSFIAVELPTELKASLAQLETQLKSDRQPGITWVDPEGIHLTLKFLGNIAINQISNITRAMGEASQEIPPFPLKVEGVEAFPNLNRIQVVWVGMSGEIDRLIQLQRNLESNLAPLGFTPESRPFTPHLTIARVRPQIPPEPRRKLGQLIANTKFEINYTFKVDSISLMKSQLTSQGALYRQIGSVKLKESSQ